MRIIKLSCNDKDMETSERGNSFFNEKLHTRKPTGQFLLTKGRISKKGISPGELLVFSYNGDIVYLALSQSERLDYTGTEASKYPFYFIVEITTIIKGKGTLKELENKIKARKNIVKTQDWPTIINKPLHFGYTQTKNGNGRLDYTPWINAYINPEPNAKLIKIPIIVIADIN